MTKPIKSDKAWYVLSVYKTCPALVLSLEPETYAACERSIAWQRVGQGEFGDYRIGYVHDGAMIGECGETIAIGQTPYTDAAWSGFLRDSGVTTPVMPDAHVLCYLAHLYAPLSDPLQCRDYASHAKRRNAGYRP